MAHLLSFEFSPSLCAQTCKNSFLEISVIHSLNQSFLLKNIHKTYSSVEAWRILCVRFSQKFNSGLSLFTVILDLVEVEGVGRREIR